MQAIRKYFIFYDNVSNSCASKGRGFYYKNAAKKLYLRFAVFEKGNLTALVFSKHSLKKIKKLLSKPKPLWINCCFGFKVIATEFYFVDKSFCKEYLQVSYNQGRNYFDYKNALMQK